MRDIRGYQITLDKAKNYQKESKSDLDYKSDQIKAQQKVIKLFDEYCTVASEAKHAPF